MFRGMSEPPELELDRSAFRQVFNGPLANPKHLRIGLVFFLAASALCAWGAWWIGAFWAAFLPIPCAVMAGIALAGLEPGFWFREPPNNT